MPLVGSLSTEPGKVPSSPMTTRVITSGVSQIAAGENHSLFVKTDGSLWGMGSNQFGQLGLTGTGQTTLPRKIIASGVSRIVADGNHSLFLKTDGSLWGMGSNADGQLGLGGTGQVAVATNAVSSGVTRLATGRAHSLFAKSDGSLWAMGSNANGQLGTGDRNATNLPVLVQPSGMNLPPASLPASQTHAWYGLYLNGEEQASGNLASVSQARPSANGQSFTGGMDELSLYRETHSAEQIQATYELEDAPASTGYEGLLAYYSMEGNASDATGNGLDGNASGTSPATDRNGQNGQALTLADGNDSLSFLRPRWGTNGPSRPGSSRT